MNNKLVKYQLKASSIAEVVIALTIIATCFGVASLIYVRTMNVTSRFQDVKLQTELQSKIAYSLLKDDGSTSLITVDGLESEVIDDELNESLKIIQFRSFDDRLIWQQSFIKTSN